VRAGSFLAAVLFFASVGCISPRSASTDVPLRVMTYNIQSGHGDLDGTAAAIRAESPDIVALQEVDVHWAERSGFEDQATLLGAKLGMHVFFAPIYSFPSEKPGGPAREFGVALLSKFNVVSFENRIITRLSTQEQNPVPKPMPGLLDAIIDVAGTKVRVLNTHLDYRADPSVRTQQVGEIVQYLAKESRPTILMGDMNAEPGALEVQPLFARLTDAWTINREPGMTYPVEDPKKRIDYVLVSKEFRVRSASVPVTLASDHRPVVVDLMLTR
jgi:endonuclease/exonuclease/phosphatase family metal-dependent hydrolase